MCVCNPSVRTPWCGKPGCEMPEQAAAEPLDWKNPLRELTLKVEGLTEKHFLRALAAAFDRAAAAIHAYTPGPGRPRAVALTKLEEAAHAAGAAALELVR